MCIRILASRWLMPSLIVSVVFVGSAYSQTQTPSVPNLSGTWELDQIGSATKKGYPKFPQMKLVIELEQSRLRVTEKRIKQGQEEVRTFVYNIDGRGDTNTGRVELWRTESPEFESVTAIDKNRIVTEYKRGWRLATGQTNPQESYVPRDTLSQLRNIWSLDAAGNRLKLTIRSLSVQSPYLTGVTSSMTDSFNDRTMPQAHFGTITLKFRRI